MIDPVELLKEYHAALNNFDLENVERMFATEAVYVSPGLYGEIKGRSDIMQAMSKYFAEYTDQVSTDESIEQLDQLTMKSVWSLATSSRAGVKTKRKGEEIIRFNINGLIERIEVEDYPSSQS